MIYPSVGRITSSFLTSSSSGLVTWLVQNIYFSKLEIHTTPRCKVSSRSDAKILLNDMWLDPQLVLIALPDRTPFSYHVMANCKAKQGFQILTDDYLRCGVMKHVEGRRAIESLGWLGLLVKMI